MSDTRFCDSVSNLALACNYFPSRFVAESDFMNGLKFDFTLKLRLLDQICLSPGSQESFLSIIHDLVYNCAPYKCQGISVKNKVN